MGEFRISRTDAGPWLEWADGGARLRYALGVEPVVQVAAEVAPGKLQVPPIGLVDGGWRAVPSMLSDAVGEWRQPAFNWNGGCAPCHGTGVVVGAQGDGGFDTRWRALAVTCEACHGDSAQHRAWLEAGGPAPRNAGFLTSLRGTRATFTFVDGGATATSSGAKDDLEGEVCGACHARRRALDDRGTLGARLLEDFEPALFEPSLFEDDGSPKAEVFEVTSFRMSRMHQLGVRCTDCHEPHSAKLRASGDAVCAQCHRLEVFSAGTHAGGRGCVECHLPTKTFLGFQPRHDHFIRVPRTEVPPAAPPPPREMAWVHFEEAATLSALSPPVRAAAGSELLNHVLRGVRVSAARHLVEVAKLPPESAAELETAERANLFRGDAFLNLAALARSQGDTRQAETWLRQGLAVDPYFAPLAVDLADLRRDESVAILRRAAPTAGPWDAEVQYALGLALLRSGEARAALTALLRAARSGDPRHVEAACLAAQKVEGADAGSMCSPKR